MNKIRPFLCAALSALLLTALTAPVSAAEEDTMLQFDENGEFRILIVADTQDTASPHEATLRLLNAELDAADADLVVFTGDQIHGPSVRTTRRSTPFSRPWPSTAVRLPPCSATTMTRAA